MTQFIKANKTTDLTNAGDFYEFYAGYNNIFHVQNHEGVLIDHIAFNTNKVINVGNTFLPDSLKVFNMSQIIDVEQKYAIHVSFSKDTYKAIDGFAIQFVNKAHLAQILNERGAIWGFNFKDLKQSHQTVTHKNQDKLKLPLNSIVVTFTNSKNKKLKERIILVPKN